MSVSPAPSAPSAPRTPVRAGALSAVNPNDLFSTRGRTTDAKGSTTSSNKLLAERESEWQATSHARRCLSCSSLGPCPCRGVSLPPEEKRRRIEAVLANTDYAKSRQRREFVRLADGEARERMAAERREGDARVLLGLLYSLHQAEASCRADVAGGEVADRGLISGAVDAMWAMVAAHGRQREAFVAEEEPAARARVEGLEGGERALLLTHFAAVAQCITESLAEQSAQREAYCSQALDILLDCCEEEDAAFCHMATMAWQMGLEAVAVITEAKAAARAALEAHAVASMADVASRREAEVAAMADHCAAEAVQRVEWAQQRVAQREAAEAAALDNARSLATEREAFLSATYSLFAEEMGQREQWLRDRASDRAEAVAVEATYREALAAEWRDGVASLKALEAAEHTERGVWAADRLAAQAAFVRGAVDALLSVQSQRADEVHALYGDFLAEHTARLRWVEEKARARGAYASECEAFLWALFSEARDASMAMAAAAEEGVADVLAFLRARAEERRQLLASAEASAATAVAAPEAAARDAIAEQFAAEGPARAAWAEERAAARRHAEATVVAAYGSIFSEEFTPSIAALAAQFAAEASAIAERRAALEALLGAATTAEAAARSGEEAAERVAFSELCSAVSAMAAAAVQSEGRRLAASLEASESEGRHALEAAVAAMYAAAFEYHNGALAALSEAALAKAREALAALAAAEAEERAAVVVEAEGALSEAYASVRGRLAALWEAAYAADASRQEMLQQRRIRLTMLREAMSVYGGSYASSSSMVSSSCCPSPSYGDDDATYCGGLPAPAAEALRNASADDVDFMSAIVFGYGDHAAAFVSNADAALHRGAQLSLEEERAARAAAALEEQRAFYSNKLFTDNATQQGKLAAARQTVANRRAEVRRVEEALREATAQLKSHKDKVEGMKDSYRGRK